ncbi:unnamed protein product [Blepharisma stoltei]|uniref:Uncharacterized protein n=1 Tax=Blepharisma stoltei TaxID=1481888 RepID=A0AAU9IIU9_9CILI|nr:unnamed protein product [Blepharisma stoltei]
MTSSISDLSKKWKPIRLRNLNEERALMKKLGKNQESSASDSAIFSDEAVSNLANSFISNESFIKCKLQSPIYKRRSEASLEYSGLIMELASAANKSLSTVLKREKEVHAENKLSTSGSETSLVIKESSMKIAKKSVNITKHASMYNIPQKSPDVSPIRPLPETNAKLSHTEKKEVQKPSIEKIKISKPNLMKSEKFDIIFAEKILPVLLKSAKISHKEKNSETVEAKGTNNEKGKTSEMIRRSKYTRKKK